MIACFRYRNTWSRRVYDFEIQTPAGAIPMAEWSVIRDGKLVSSRLLFDTAAMAALMPAG